MPATASRNLADAVERLVTEFSIRWPGYDVDARTSWLRALSGAPPEDVDALVLDAVVLDDRPPTPADLARRVAERIARRLDAGGAPAPRRREWTPDPAVLDLIRRGRDRMAAAADRYRV